MKIKIFFGSKSDEKYGVDLVSQLNENHQVEIFYLSAHRNPVELLTLVKEENFLATTELVIAGAGLAAHLPGAIASHLCLPVIGLPLKGNFNGLDALLSIVQMPKGIPVVTSGVGNIQEIIKFVNYHDGKKYKRLMFLLKNGNFEIENISAKFLNITKSLALNAEISHNIKDVEKSDFVITNDTSLEVDSFHPIRIPLFNNDKIDSIDSVPSFYTMINRCGLWIGANQVENAVLWACRFHHNWFLSNKEKLLAFQRGELK